MSFYKEHNINPAASCLPMVCPDPGLHRALLRAQALREPSAPGGNLEWLGLVGHHRPRLRRLGQAAARHLRRQPDGVDLLHVDDDGQDAALPDDGPAAALRQLHRQLPDRAAALLGDDEPVDGRAGPHHAPARAEDAGAVAVQRASRKPPRSRTAATARRSRPPAPKPAAAPPAAPQQRAGEAARRRARGGERRRAALRRGDGRDGRRGEVGRRCASSSALLPGIDKAAVRFQVVSEGERGLLGVGYEPARVRRDGRPAAPWPSRRARATTRARPPRMSASCSSASPPRSASPAEIDDRGGRRVDRRDLRGRRPGAADRPSRPDDRLGPVPRERDRLQGRLRESEADRRRRSRLSRPPRGDAAPPSRAGS